MADDSLTLPPLSEVALIDVELSKCVRRVFSAADGGEDMGRLSSLILRRAEATLPRALVERVHARRLKG